MQNGDRGLLDPFTATIICLELAEDFGVEVSTYNQLNENMMFEYQRSRSLIYF